MHRMGSFTSRIERAILGMVHFPGERLLEVLGYGSDAQVQHTDQYLSGKRY